MQIVELYWLRCAATGTCGKPPTTHAIAEVVAQVTGCHMLIRGYSQEAIH